MQMVSRGFVNGAEDFGDPTTVSTSPYGVTVLVHRKYDLIANIKTLYKQYKFICYTGSFQSRSIYASTDLNHTHTQNATINLSFCMDLVSL